MVRCGEMTRGWAMQDALAHLRGLGRTQFEVLLANWYRGVKGKFKVPTFAHQELDLYAVFWDVLKRGGSDHVTTNKQWKVRRLPCCNVRPPLLDCEFRRSYVQNAKAVQGVRPVETRDFLTL